MKNQKAIVETRSLAIGYRSSGTERTVAADLDLQLRPGSLVCLLGSNGAGKSTLMRTLSGLQPALTGEITIDNRPLHALKPAELAQKLSLVLTDRIDAGNLTAREVVALGRTPYTGWLGTLTKDDHSQIAQSIEQTGIAPLLDRHMHQLSDGERQKVMLARALAQDTPLILLDEPTAHLDLPNRVEMMRLLHTLARNMHKAILLSTHELDLALQTADELWLMHPDGKILAGPPEDLVLSGAFEATFARNGFSFDRTTGTFIIHQPVDNAQIYLEGAEKPLFWVRRALQREGLGVSNHRNAPCLVSVFEAENGFEAEIIFQNQQVKVSSVQALIGQMHLFFPSPSHSGMTS
ncbi:iron complex transport system ATP-binding protein [Dyadobacter sp. BE34]|uniref:Iron complex transport system ATP-binding protein n=1 Tax=Dyadobacter fermentans TaxID=94254 RepID=A0ABU1R841_9BACT|nr:MULTISPECIES: ABC transporter ATP-binding protein [Dyadobacter]MDR6809565.1 iron complex transport system ATP-binding protein [Dyadobacter fermentans]MDR7047178.1 iron complex transport system ATP-binding protein [Dyadobacter sp. BE242]MDR7201414.1 iron complex transport system ATP-binding protein [Dyadobacter sp. BE34]MDR7219284.1 iron complex transport system ATP-binding protein [Dyadobacter sp. BE31]MDR7267050.1 iron complex transport system ATP-binding protein [Dyadobacter sp. BE32]